MVLLNDYLSHLPVSIPSDICHSLLQIFHLVGFPQDTTVNKVKNFKTDVQKITLQAQTKLPIKN